MTYRGFQGTITGHGLDHVNVLLEMEPEYEPGDSIVKYYRARWFSATGPPAGHPFSVGEEYELQMSIGPFRASTVAAHDLTGAFVWVLYRINQGEGTRTAWEGLVEVGSPPEKFRDAYRLMEAKCAELNGAPPPDWAQREAAAAELRRLGTAAAPQATAGPLV